MNVKQIKARITRAFKQYASAPARSRFDPIPKALTAGKLYESYVLGLVAAQLSIKEGLQLRLMAGTQLRLKSSPGPINRRFPRIDVYRGQNCIAELWTDVEFLTLSCVRRSGQYSPTQGDYHELDIVMLKPGCNGRPTYEMISLAIECKNTGYSKSLLKEILGIRRELSFLSEEQRTCFNSWPHTMIPADPPSCLLVYSTDDNVIQYSKPGDVFGIDFFYKPM